MINPWRLHRPFCRVCWLSAAFGALVLFPSAGMAAQQGAAASETHGSEVRAAQQVTISARVADTAGKPVGGQRVMLTATSVGESYETFADSDDEGTVLMAVPRGSKEITLSLRNDDPDTVTRFESSDDAHLRLDGRLERSELYQDWKRIEITRYRCPTLVVKAVNESGGAIELFKPQLTYFSTPANAVRSVGGQRGEIRFAQVDGSWRSEQLIPNKDFTLAVTSPNYQAAFETHSFREGETKEVTVTLQLDKIADEPARGLQLDARNAAEHPNDNRSYTNALGMRFVLIPAGDFVMGSPEDEEGRPPQIGERKNVEELQHTVRITRPFYMSAFEVTQEQYEAVMGENPSQWSLQGTHSKRVAELDTRRFPVENVRWFEANEFCKRISAIDGETYRLPTEAEWEYACRAGTTTVFNFGDVADGTAANIEGIYPAGTKAVGDLPGRPTVVGTFAPNPFGLYDMHGNVWEWCSDLSANGYYAMTPRDDPQGPPVTAFNPRYVKEATYNRSLRGGAFYLEGRHCRSAARQGWAPDFVRDHVNRPVGIRVVCEIPDGMGD